MSKRKASKGYGRKILPASFPVLYTSALNDLAPHIGVAETDSLMSLLHRNPKRFREAVDELTSNAESCLATGGVIRYAALRQLQALFSKNRYWDAEPEQEIRDRTVAKFLETEEQCKRTNKRLLFYAQHFNRAPLAHSVLEEAALWLQQVLPPVESVANLLREGVAFGPGVTFGTSHVSDRTLYHKVSQDLTCTASALPYVQSLMFTSPNWFNYLVKQDKTFDIVPGNRVALVPKKRDIARTIAVEPSLNVYLQKGIESFLKRKVFPRLGITINDQIRNRHIAYEASIDGKHSTIDLSSASDTIAIELVRQLFPADWFGILDDLRSHEFTFSRKSGTWTRYEKFSSMGNATTFPIETLIFFSLARQCVLASGGDLSKLRVYGDDIIIDIKAHALLLEVMAYAGFTVNREKTHIFSPFRETCGYDVVSGIDIRPVYCLESLTKEHEVYCLYNRLLLHSMFPLPSTLRYIRSLVPGGFIGPWYFGMGDSDGMWHEGLSVDYCSYFIDERPNRWYVSASLQTRMYRYVELYASTPTHLGKDEEAAYLSFLLGMKSGAVPSVHRIKRRPRKRSTSFWPSLARARELQLLGRMGYPTA